ncbi:50S ribosomal protein L9 [Acanthopleuribacter pedis]
MQVLLKEAVVKLGNRGDVVKVAPGYARNYLLPKSLAVLVTEGNKRQLEIEKRNYEKRLLETKAVAEEAKARLEEIHLEVEKRAGDNGSLFGGVTVHEIHRALLTEGFEVERRVIELPHIKELGEYTASVRLHPEVSAEFSITVKPVA